jgi:hypothetical protein
MDGVGEPGARWANPRWHYPEYPPGSVVEIRVHGVGGEPPSGMTRDPFPVLVGGDEKAGFYRARNPVVGPATEDGEDGDGDGPGPRRPLHVREVLAWGGQTSGTFRHAFWVLLLPFSLFNLAGRMHPTHGWRAPWHRAICRVLALSMTLATVGLTTAMVIDLLAVQCPAAGEACLGGEAGGPLLLAPLRAFAANAHARLGLVALVPAALLVALWYAGRYGTQRLEGESSFPTEASARSDADGSTPAAESNRAGHEPVSLDDRDFWRNAWPTSRLRALHATAGFAWIGGTLALSLWAAEGDLRDGLLSTAWGPLVVLAASVVLSTSVLAALPAMARPGPSRPLHAFLATFRLLALGVLGFAAGAALSTGTSLAWWVLSDELVRGSGLVVGGVLVLWWMTGDLAPWSKRDEPGKGGASAFTLGDLETPDVGISGNLKLAVGAMLVGVGSGVSAGGFAAASIPEMDLTLGNAPGLPDWVGQKLLPDVFVAPYLPMLALAAAQVLLLLGLASMAFERRPPLRRDASPLDTGHPVRWNLTAVVLALLSLLLLTAVGAGLHALALEWLTRGAAGSAATGAVAAPDLSLPWWWEATGLVVVAAVVLTVLAWLRPAFRRRRQAPDDRAVKEHLRAAYEEARLSGPARPEDGELAEKTDDRRVGKIGGAWMTQRLIRDAGAVLGGAVGMTAVVAGIFLGLRLAGVLGDELPLATAALLLLAALPLGGVALVRMSLRDRNTRREVGRLWDVATFWPRVTHPFAPPCYAEALVPMLEKRVRFLLTATRPAPADGSGQARPRPVPLDYRVVLAGHSQGSVVSVAAAARLDPEPADASRGTATSAATESSATRVALVSYGSPLAILYERFFRGTFGYAGDTSSLQTAGLRTGPAETLYDHVLHRVHSWHHLFAMTEPFAFPFWEHADDAHVTGAGREGGADAETEQALHRSQGWPITGRLPRADAPCSVCLTPGARVGLRLEALVRDPDRWLLPDGGTTESGGHSVYHRHPDVDRHLTWIARSLTRAASPPDAGGLRRAGAPAPPPPEQRTGQWWRAGH